MTRDEPKANTYAESLAAVLAHSRALEAEPVPFRDALGRVLAEPVRALANDPPAPKSAMDGFALRAAETRDASPGHPLRFAYEEVVGAGHVAARALPPEGAVRIMTGALLPAGADAVVKLEDTLPDKEAGAPPRHGTFRITAPLAPGENVFGPGSRFARSDLLIPAGVPLGAQALGLIAGQGLTSVRAVRLPRVALLALGDELTEPGRPLPPGGIYVSNLYALEAEVRRLGAEPEVLGIAPDDPLAIAARLRPRVEGQEGAPPADCVLTLGGSRGGDFDFVGDVLERVGARLRFRRTLINWGGSTLFATRGGTLCFGLPGTPLVSWLACEVFVRPALWRLGGRRELERPRLRARLSESLARPRGRTHFIPARVEFPPDGPPRATPLDERPTRGLPTSLLADGLILYPEGVERLAAGEEVPVAWLRG
jgi:molybdopterin molybdotransferase